MRRARAQAEPGPLGDPGVLGRLEADDRRDELDRFEADSAPQHSSFEDSSEAESRPEGGTVHEEDQHVESTVKLPGQEGEGSLENLSNPSGTVDTSTLIATPKYRPSRRPPMAVLRVYDDNQTSYQEVRIRKTPFEIGRVKGDLVISHENLMSGQHVRIVCEQAADGWRWSIQDLRARNGTFLRVESAELEDGGSLFLGGDMVRFHQQAGSPSAELVKVAPAQEVQRITVQPGTHRIGTDTNACLPFLSDSLYLDPKHLVLQSDDSGRWSIFDQQSTNNLWLGFTDKRPLKNGDFFLAGEQRFSFHTP